MPPLVDPEVEKIQLGRVVVDSDTTPVASATCIKMNIRHVERGGVMLIGMQLPANLTGQ